MNSLYLISPDKMKKPGSYRELNSLTISRISNSEKRLFLLDFDGTLVDIASEVAGAVPSEDILSILKRLSGIPRNHLVIITGRSRATIEHLLGSMNIDIVAEHGAIIRENGIWKNLNNVDTSWKEKILPVLEKVTSHLPGSIIEDKQHSVAWHYRNADKRSGIRASGELSDMLGNLLKSLDLTLTHGKKVIEIMNNKNNKGHAAKYLTDKNGYDFILSIGDDTTDEEMFITLGGNQNAITVRIGRADTHAKFKLNNLLQVKKLLVNIIKNFEDFEDIVAN